MNNRDDSQSNQTISHTETAVGPQIADAHAQMRTLQERVKEQSDIINSFTNYINSLSDPALIKGTIDNIKAPYTNTQYSEMDKWCIEVLQKRYDAMTSPAQPNPKATSSPKKRRRQPDNDRPPKKKTANTNNTSRNESLELEEDQEINVNLQTGLRIINNLKKRTQEEREKFSYLINTLTARQNLTIVFNEYEKKYNEKMDSERFADIFGEYPIVFRNPTINQMVKNYFRTDCDSSDPDPETQSSKFITILKNQSQAEQIKFKNFFDIFDDIIDKPGICMWDIIKTYNNKYKESMTFKSFEQQFRTDMSKIRTKEYRKAIAEYYESGPAASQRGETVDLTQQDNSECNTSNNSGLLNPGLQHSYSQMISGHEVTTTNPIEEQFPFDYSTDPIEEKFNYDESKEKAEYESMTSQFKLVPDKSSANESIKKAEQIITNLKTKTKEERKKFSDFIKMIKSNHGNVSKAFLEYKKKNNEDMSYYIFEQICGFATTTFRDSIIYNMVKEFLDKEKTEVYVPPAKDPALQPKYSETQDTTYNPFSDGTYPNVAATSPAQPNPKATSTNKKRSRQPIDDRSEKKTGPGVITFISMEIPSTNNTSTNESLKLKNSKKNIEKLKGQEIINKLKERTNKERRKFYYLLKKLTSRHVVSTVFSEYDKKYDEKMDSERFKEICGEYPATFRDGTIKKMVMNSLCADCDNSDSDPDLDLDPQSSKFITSLKNQSQAEQIEFKNFFDIFNKKVNKAGKSMQDIINEYNKEYDMSMTFGSFQKQFGTPMTTIKLKACRKAITKYYKNLSVRSEPAASQRGETIDLTQPDNSEYNNTSNNSGLLSTGLQHTYGRMTSGDEVTTTDPIEEQFDLTQSYVTTYDPLSDSTYTNDTATSYNTFQTPYDCQTPWFQALTTPYSPADQGWQPLNPQENYLNPGDQPNARFQQVQQVLSPVAVASYQPQVKENNYNQQAPIHHHQVWGNPQQSMTLYNQYQQPMQQQNQQLNDLLPPNLTDQNPRQ